MSFIVRANHERMAVVEECEVLKYHHLTEKYICNTEIGEFARNKDEIFETKEEALKEAISQTEKIKLIFANMYENYDDHLNLLERELRTIENRLPFLEKLKSMSNNETE